MRRSLKQTKSIQIESLILFFPSLFLCTVILSSGLDAPRLLLSAASSSSKFFSAHHYTCTPLQASTFDT